MEIALKRLTERVRKVIDAEKNDPLRYGWEPPIWKVCDALLGFDFCEGAFRRAIKKRFDWTWEEWAEAMRQHLGFLQPVVMLLILGANRSSKSEYSAKRGQLVLTDKPNSSVCAFHMSDKRSIKNQQPLFWKYMPPEYRTQRAGVDEYIKYKRKTGFSEGGFINAVGSECMFSNYSQDRTTAIEGREDDLVLPDELIPADWVDTLLYRLTTRGGKGIITFTPVKGYTPTVKMFSDSATVTKESIGYMLPKDGGDPDNARAIGLTQEEYEELLRAGIEKRPAKVPHSRPEDCCAWLEGETGQMDAPPGRLFEMVPRVMKCVDPQLGVVYFHGSDNPYGNPKNVIKTAQKKGAIEIRIRVYGKAERSVSGIFPKFSLKVHRIRAKDIPKEGTNYMFMDPAADRNFFMSWLRATSGKKVYVYREWPGTDSIPGIGVPDPWAVPSGKKEGINDGSRGRGAESFGFGLLRYKFEIARLEQWAAYGKWLLGSDAEYPLNEELEIWDELDGAEEIMEARYVDSRAASNPRVENDRPVTMYQDLLDIGMDFMLAPGAQINDGVEKINTALDYDEDEDLSFLNEPTLYVSDECPNTLYALENWMNVDGQHGACKDPIDNLRYYFTAETGYVPPGTRDSRRGFHYGRAARRRDDNSDRPRPGRIRRAEFRR
jgi:hypothetical protein